MAYCVVSIYSFRYLAKFWALFNPFHPGGSFPHFESEWGFSAFDSIKMRRVPRRKQKWYFFTFLMSWAEQEFNYQKVSACFGGSKASKICENFTMWILLYGVIDMMIQIRFWTPKCVKTISSRHGQLGASKLRVGRGIFLWWNPVKTGNGFQL